MNNTLKYLRIKRWLDHYGIKNYTINGDWTIDVYASVDLGSKGLRTLPDYIQFGHVSGEFFDCDYNRLTSLEGAPDRVDGAFDCSHNKLTTLEGAPKHVGGYFDCSHNELTSLEGAPDYVGGNFYCSCNKLISLEGAPSTVDGYFYCDHNARKLARPGNITIGGEFIN